MKKLKEPIFKSSSEKSAKTAPAEQPAEKPSKQPATGSCLVNIDNNLAFECDVVVDGSKQATLKPFSIIELGLKKGKHDFRFMRGQEETDKITAELSEAGTTVINPLAAGTYSLYTVYYSTGGPFSGREPSSEIITSQRVVHADYGLLQPVPDSIMIKTAKTFIPTPYNAKTDSRTKVCKLVNPMPSTAEAIAMLSASSCVYVVHGSSGMDHLLKPAIKQLGDAGKDPAIMDTLIAMIETCRENSGPVSLDVIFEALKKYLPEMPEQRLTSWVTTPCTNNYEIAATRVELASQFLFSMKKETAITNAFSGLPEINRIRMLRASMASGSPAIRRQLVKMALQNCSKDIETEVRNMISLQDFEADEDVLRAFANQTANLPIVNENDKNRKRQLERILLHKLRQNMKTLDSKWLTEELAEFAMSEDRGIRSDALAALVEVGKIEELVKILPQVDQDNRKYSLRAGIESCGRNSQAITPAVMDLFRLGLTDKESSTRTDSFRSIASIYYNTKSGDILSLLQETSRKESDPAVISTMDECLRVYLPAPAPATTAPSSPRRSASSTRKNASAGSGSAAAVKEPPPPDPSGWPAIKVSGIVNSAGGKVAALINGQIVTEGESVSGVKIIAITRTDVEVTYKGEKRSIPVRGGR